MRQHGTGHSASVIRTGLLILLLCTASAAAPQGNEAPDLSSWLLRLASTGESEESRIEAYEGLENSGGRESLLPLLEALAGDPPGVKRQADRTLLAVLRRVGDPAGYALVENSLRGLATEERARVAAAVAKADSPLGLELLGRLVGQYPDISLTVLSGIAGMKCRPDNGNLAASIRPLMLSESSNLRREAISALGNLHDADSVEEFLALLSGEQAGVAGNAHWALRRLSDLNLPPDPVRWNMWLSSERSWWESEGKRFLSELAEGSEEQILRALHHAALHPLYRAEFEQLLNEHATSSNPEIRAAANRALLALRLRDGDAATITGGGAMVTMKSISRAEAHAVTGMTLKPVKQPEPRGSNLCLILLGLPLCLTLLLKVSGLAPVMRFRSWLHRSGTERGPVTMKLGARSQRLRKP